MLSVSYSEHGKIGNREVARKFGINQETMKRYYPMGAKLAYVALSGKKANYNL